MKQNGFLKVLFFMIVAIGVYSFFINTSYSGPCDDGCCYPKYTITSCNLNASKTGCNSTVQMTWQDCACGSTFPYTHDSCIYNTNPYCAEFKCCEESYTCNIRSCYYDDPIVNGRLTRYCDYYPSTCYRTVCKAKCGCQSTATNPTCTLTKSNSYQSCSYVTPPPPTCVAETACTPTCPSGTVNYNTGLPAPSASCSYRTGNVTSSNTCQQATNTVNCWYPLPSTPPVVTTTFPNNSNALGCVAPVNYVGQESNNTTNFEFVFDDPDSLNQNEALMVWFSDIDTTSVTSYMNKIYDTGTPRSMINSRYGFLVRKEASGWNSIYVPGYDGTTNNWVKAGTIGSGLRAEINGVNSKKMVGIRDVSVSTASLKNTLRFSLQFYNETSGLSDYEKVTDSSYAIYGATNRRSSFLPTGGNTILSVPQWLNSGKDIVIDLNNPVADSLAIVFGSNANINLTWRYSDSFSPIVRSIGDATRPSAGKINENIDDITSGVSNYAFGSGATGTNLFSGLPHLWVANNLATRTDTIDLNNNEGGTIQFQSWGFDRSCNYASTTSSVPMGSAWMTTRGGVVYSSGGVNFEIFPLTGHSGFSADAYWAAPFAFYKDEADVTTELVSASTSAINALLYPTKGTTRSLNHFDVNNRTGYWFDNLREKNLEQIANNPTKFVTLNYSSNLATSSTSSALNDGTTTCDVSKNCVINVSGNLSLNSGFVCDAKTTFLVSGSTNIEPDITASGFAQGCIIVSKGDITISDGIYKSGSSTYPKYDIVEAFMISDGKINIPLVDSASDVRDGLLVHGSILGFGTVDGLSINLARSLKPIFNQSYPTVAVHFDNRYLNIATEVFGGDVEGYRREVGFKPY